MEWGGIVYNGVEGRGFTANAAACTQTLPVTKVLWLDLVHFCECLRVPH